jgi:hypothetical protein
MLATFRVDLPNRFPHSEAARPAVTRPLCSARRCLLHFSCLVTTTVPAGSSSVALVVPLPGGDGLSIRAMKSPSRESGPGCGRVAEALSIRIEMVRFYCSPLSHLRSVPLQHSAWRQRQAGASRRSPSRAAPERAYPYRSAGSPGRSWLGVELKHGVKRGPADDIPGTYQ